MVLEMGPSRIGTVSNGYTGITHGVPQGEWRVGKGLVRVSVLSLQTCHLALSCQPII